MNDYPVAIIGSGNIGTDLMIKIRRSDGPLRVAAMVGIDPNSDGLARAARLGVPTTAGGVDGLLAMPEFADIKLVFDATSAGAHRANWAKLAPTGVRMLDLTPAAVGPYCVPVVNVDKCTACGDCVTACPRTLLPAASSGGENAARATKRSPCLRQTTPTA